MDLTEISYKCRLRPGFLYNNVKQISTLWTGHIPPDRKKIYPYSHFYALLKLDSQAQYMKVPNITPFPWGLFSYFVSYTYWPWLHQHSSPKTCYFVATYFNAIMFMVAASVVTTILILNYHHRNQQTHTMPYWVRLCQYWGQTQLFSLY